MNSTNNTHDDQCQHPDGCIKSLFTYCPHCHLYLCIIHLNQHHDAMKTDIHRTINEAENHRVLIEQQINKIKEQQTSLNDLYEREIKNLNDINQFLTNICENNYLFSSEYERYIKQFEFIKQDHRNNSFLQAFILQIDQILQQQNQILESKDEISITTNILSVLDSEITNDAYSESCTKEEEEQELTIESATDCHSNELSIDQHNEIDSDTLSLQSKSSINSVYPTCPLSQVNAFGFSIDHHIPGVPCNFQKYSKPLTSDRCYYHLLSYHRLKPRVVRVIMKTLSSNKNQNLDLTTLDMFAHWTSEDILSRGTSLFIGQCPLTQENIYGLQNQHKVTLCIPRPPVHLYQHLRSVHHFKPNNARRLISAIIQNIPLTEEIFKPNEQIINKSTR